MRILLSIICLHLFLTVFAQQEVPPDTSGTDVEFRQLFLPQVRICLKDFVMIKSEDDLKNALASCGFKKTDTLSKINFEKNILVFRSSWGDCHAKFRFRFVIDDKNKKLRLLEYNYYGGCRGMGAPKNQWFVVQKPPKDYSVEITEILSK